MEFSAKRSTLPQTPCGTAATFRNAAARAADRLGCARIGSITRPLSCIILTSRADSRSTALRDAGTSGLKQRFNGQRRQVQQTRSSGQAASASKALRVPESPAALAPDRDNGKGEAAPRLASQGARKSELGGARRYAR